MNLELTELEEENKILKKRLKHLLKSETIRKYDEVDIKTKEYKYDINELDNIQNITPQFVINADENTILIFKIKKDIKKDVVEEIKNQIKKEIKCKCLISSESIDLKHIILKNEELLKLRGDDNVKKDIFY